VLATVCCVPTLSIATIVGCTKMASAPQVYSVSRSGGAGGSNLRAAAALPRMEFRGVSSNTEHGSFSFGSPGVLDAAGKLDLLLLVCARVASGCCVFETDNNYGDPSGNAGMFD
jgi:hypothetical protein